MKQDYEVSGEELKELTERQAEAVKLENPIFYQTPVEAFDALKEKYPDAVHYRHQLGRTKDGSLTLIHLPIDANGEPCGSGQNNSNPCPPNWQ